MFFQVTKRAQVENEQIRGLPTSSPARHSRSGQITNPKGNAMHNPDNDDFPAAASESWEWSYRSLLERRDETIEALLDANAVLKSLLNETKNLIETDIYWLPNERPRIDALMATVANVLDDDDDDEVEK